MLFRSDSFTYNIFHWLDTSEKNISICRNDEITISKIIEMDVSHIIISPGPMGPNDAGISCEMIRHFKDEIPILGICLGHQCIAEVFGCKVLKHPKPTHGKKSKVNLKESTIYRSLDKTITAARYHSLHVSKDQFNYNDLKINASLNDGTIMGIEYKTSPVFGLQFHPESILTGYVGRKIMNNFLAIETKFSTAD